MKIDASNNAINRISNQLSLHGLLQLQLVDYFSQKKIPAETQYKTHHSELLAIVKDF